MSIKSKLKRKNQARNLWILDRHIRMMRIANKIRAEIDKALEREKQTGTRLISTLVVNEPLPPNTESRESVEKRWAEFIEKHGDKLKEPSK